MTGAPAGRISVYRIFAGCATQFVKGLKGRQLLLRNALPNSKIIYGLNIFAASYNSMRKDSAEYALIRLLVGDTDKAVDLLSQNEYIFDLMPVIALELDNRPGELAKITTKFGEEDININYVYGSVQSPDSKCLFVFCPEDIDLAAKIFKA